MGSVAGVVIVGLGAASLFGPVGSVGFIASMAGGGALACFSIGGIVVIAITNCVSQKPGDKASLQEVEQSANKTKSDSISKEGWWQSADFDAIIEEIDQSYNTSPPKEGYIIRCDEKGPKVISRGNARASDAELRGVPKAHPINCNFCEPRVPSVKDFDACRLIASRSNTPLIIPSGDEIPIHWFQASKGTKIALLNATQDVMDQLYKQLPGSKLYFELHCGSPGAQTVWHLHLRIHRAQRWSKVDWKSQIQ